MRSMEVWVRGANRQLCSRCGDGDGETVTRLLPREVGSIDLEVLADDDFAGVAGGDLAQDLLGRLAGED